jgi:hypothetical protein
MVEGLYEAERLEKKLMPDIIENIEEGVRWSNSAGQYFCQI